MRNCTKSLTSFFAVLRAEVCIYGNVLQAPFSTAGESFLLEKKDHCMLYFHPPIFIAKLSWKREKRDTVPPVGVIIPIYYSLGMPCGVR